MAHYITPHPRRIPGLAPGSHAVASGSNCKEPPACAGDATHLKQVKKDNRYELPKIPAPLPEDACEGGHPRRARLHQNRWQSPCQWIPACAGIGGLRDMPPPRIPKSSPGSA